LKAGGTPKNGRQRNVFSHLQRRLVQFSGKERSTLFRALSLLFGATLFLIVILWVLITLVGMFTASVRPHSPSSLAVVIGFTFNAFGLFFVAWSAASLWILGKGTPAPFAPTQRLVVDGPYRLCRNPMKLGAISYYLGVGTLFDSLATGIGCFLVALAIWTFYHKTVEEKELAARFGKDYQAYKKSTPFLIPSFKTKADQESSRPTT
jgi:protein-S-isoprenylcysteine O-methyltransferase Ste14